MSHFQISPLLIERLGWVLVHSFWQFALIALLAGAAVRLLSRGASAMRHGVLGLAIAAILIVPAVTWMLQPVPLPADSSSSPEFTPEVALTLNQESNVPATPGAEGLTTENSPDFSPRTIEEARVPLNADFGSSMEMPADVPLAAPAVHPPIAQHPVEVSWSERLTLFLRPWLIGIVSVWSVGVLLCSLRPLLGWRMLWRLRREGISPASGDVRASLRHVSERLGIRRAVCVLQSTLTEVPILVGYLRPVILLPVSLVTTIPASQLEALLAHELAHVRRHDFLINLLQTLVETAFFYHPAVWWLSHQLRAERENCCDDLVVRALGNRVEYGRALLAVEELRGRNSVLAIGAADGSLLTRIRRIAGLQSNTAPSSPWPSLSLIACGLIAACAVCVSSWQSLAGHPQLENRMDEIIAKHDADANIEKHEGVIESLGKTVILFDDGRSISTDAVTKYTGLTDKGEQPADRKELKPRVRVVYEFVPGTPATKVIIIPETKAPENPEEATVAPPGKVAKLELLTLYPKLHDLSLAMTEQQFLAIVKREGLTARKTAEGGGNHYWIPADEAHSVIVMFGNNGEKCSGIQRVRGQAPEPIQVVLKLNRKEFLLGESIAVEYEMTNDGTEEAPYGKGGFYPALRINDGFRMSATKVDDNGKPIGEPVGTWPMPENFGGPETLGGIKLKPNETYSTTLFATRYLKFQEPGRYRLRVENVDRLKREPKRAYSSGETYLTLKQPTPEEARRVFEQMKQAPRNAYDDNAMKFLPEAADFQAIHQPVYLPILKEYAEKGDRDALESLERMERLDANEVLVAALGSALDRDDWRTGRACFYHLKNCLPFPNWYIEPLTEYDQPNRDRVARLWEADFGPTLTRLAKRMNAEVASLMQRRKAKPPGADANDRAFLKVFRNGYFPPEHPQSLLIDIDFIYRCLGRPEDFSDCLAAFARSIELTKSLPLETNQYFRPRGSAFGFGHTVSYMLRRGAKAPEKPAHPGEAAAFVIAMQMQDNYRPPGWQAELMKWLKFDSPYLAEVILDRLPVPVPAEVLDYLPTALADDYIDLQIAACHVAKKHPRAAYREPIQKILDTAKDEYLRKFAVDAARANGINARYDADAPFVD